ncbi:MAG: hypothetical protein OXB98_18295 [Bryobacterales bacterium]|nr:hypothetical protein [Bryobacterales bacterium]
MKTPAHPDQSVSHDFLEPVGIGVTEAAKKLGGNRNSLFDGANGLSGISPKMTIRLDKELQKSTTRCYSWT